MKNQQHAALIRRTSLEAECGISGTRATVHRQMRALSNYSTNQLR